MGEMAKWIPGALDSLQGWKRLVQLAMNVAVVLALAQFAGVDVEAITKGNLVPPMPWWGTAAVAVALVGVEARLANAQELRKREGETGANSAH